MHSQQNFIQNSPSESLSVATLGGDRLYFDTNSTLNGEETSNSSIYEKMPISSSNSTKMSMKCMAKIKDEKNSTKSPESFIVGKIKDNQFSSKPSLKRHNEQKMSPIALRTLRRSIVDDGRKVQNRAYSKKEKRSIRVGLFYTWSFGGERQRKTVKFNKKEACESVDAKIESLDRIWLEAASTLTQPNHEYHRPSQEAKGISGRPVIASCKPAADGCRPVADLQTSSAADLKSDKTTEKMFHEEWYSSLPYKHSCSNCQTRNGYRNSYNDLQSYNDAYRNVFPYTTLMKPTVHRYASSQCVSSRDLHVVPYRNATYNTQSSKSIASLENVSAKNLHEKLSEERKSFNGKRYSGEFQMKTLDSDPSQFSYPFRNPVVGQTAEPIHFHHERSIISKMSDNSCNNGRSSCKNLAGWILALTSIMVVLLVIALLVQGK